MKSIMDKKKLIIIEVILVCIIGIVAFCFGIKQSKVNKINKLHTMLNESLEIKVNIDENKNLELITLNDTDNIDEVEVWAFSEPVYLGKFTLVKNDGKYYLEGIENILKTKDLESGSHRLLVMKDKKALGYIRIELNQDKSFKLDDIKTPEDEIVNDESNSIFNEDESSNVIIPNDSTDTSKKEDDKVESTVKEDTINKKEEIKTPTNRVEETTKEEPKQEEVKCTPKKFKNKYTYVYDDYDTCVKNGDQLDAWNYFKEHGISAYNYGCEKIVDECGNIYYGVYFGNMEGEKYYY